jgi:hypothetical protein
VIVLGFDQSPNGIGFAYGEPGSKPTRGYRENPDCGDAEGELEGYVYDWALKFYDEVRPDAIFYEQVVVRKVGFDIQVLYKQLAVVSGLRFAARQRGLGRQFYISYINEWRTWFHHGLRPQKHPVLSATEIWKDMALKECAARNWWTSQHDVAEACGIWDWGCQELDSTYRARSRVLRRRAEHVADEERRAAL